MNRITQRLGSALAHYLNQPAHGPYPHLPADLVTLRRILRLADVILVEGRARISSTIRYLTQSTWSHVALYVGTMPGRPWLAAATCWLRRIPNWACACAICNS